LAFEVPERLTRIASPGSDRRLGMALTPHLRVPSGFVNAEHPRERENRTMEQIGWRAQAPPPAEVQSVARSLSLLRCFANGERWLTLTELARRTNLSGSTAHRLLRTLCIGGFLIQDDDTERYGLGGFMVRLAQEAFVSSGLAAATGVLQHLVQITGESASLGVREGSEVVVLVSLESDQPIRFTRPAGSRVPVHTSAMGRALLAFGPDPIEKAVASLGTLRRQTPRTIVSTRKLVADLRAAHDRGTTLVDEEQHLGLRSVGAPICDAAGIARAAISVQGLTVRMPMERTEVIANAVDAAAKELAQVLALGLLESTRETSL
jgi:IclR family acetate operon transcriptional repressor